MAGVEDDVIETVDLRGPCVIELVEVEVEEPGVGGAVGIPVVVADQKRSPEVGQGEVVSNVFPSFEMLVGCGGHVDWVFYLKLNNEQINM